MSDTQLNASFLQRWTQAQSIQPPFPNWQRSFVSGPNSILFRLEHRIEARKESSKDPALLTQIQYHDAAEGPPGHVHGGANAGLIDELMGIVVWHHQYFCVTQSLKCNFLRPVPLSSQLWGLTAIQQINENKITVHCTLFSQSTENKKMEYVTADAVFHRLTAEQLDQFRTHA
jgi:acyl-coenzyme A thioesterase PaaI-like protein